MTFLKLFDAATVPLLANLYSFGLLAGFRDYTVNSSDVLKPLCIVLSLREQITTHSLLPLVFGCVGIVVLFVCQPRK